MTIESLLPVAGGSALVGFASGFFIKKMIKIVLFIAGGLILLLMYLQSKNIIKFDQVQLERSANDLANTTIAQTNHILNTANNHHNLIDNNMIIPLSSFGICFLIGFRYG